LAIEFGTAAKSEMLSLQAEQYHFSSALLLVAGTLIFLTQRCGSYLLWSRPVDGCILPFWL
jgi:hypothetical protein